MAEVPPRTEVSDDEKLQILQLAHQADVDSLRIFLSIVASQTRRTPGEVLADAVNARDLSAAHVVAFIPPDNARVLLAYITSHEILPSYDPHLRTRFMNLPSSRDHGEYTPLLYACRLGCASDLILTIFHAYGSIDPVSKNGWGPVHCAVGSHAEAPRLIDLLCNRIGCNPYQKARNRHGNTPAHLAARYGNVRALSTLMDVTKQKCLGMRNAEGQNPREVAEAFGQQGVLDFLNTDAGVL